MFLSYQATTTATKSWQRQRHRGTEYCILTFNTSSPACVLFRNHFRFKPSRQPFDSSPRTSAAINNPAQSSTLNTAMPLRDILHKKDRLNSSDNQYATRTIDTHENSVPEIRFVRSDTTTQDIIIPPSHQDDESYLASARPSSSSSHRKSLNPFHRSRSPSESGELASPTRPRGERRLSHLLRRDRRGSSASANIPSDLPQIEPNICDEHDREAQWEKRATFLAQHSPQPGSSPGHSPAPSIGLGSDSIRPQSRSSSYSRINDPQGDVS